MTSKVPRWAVWAGVGVALGLGLAWLAGTLSGSLRIQASSTGDFALVSSSPKDGAEGSATASIDLVFSQPADLGSVQTHWNLSPPVSGVFQSAGDMIRFVPDSPFTIGQTVTVTLSAGVASVDGSQQLDGGTSWTFVIRAPRAAFLSPTAPPRSVMISEPAQGGSPVSLLSDDRDVVAFAVSPGGDRLALVMGNDAQGQDVWTVDGDGAQLTRRTDCGADVCGDPVWLPDRTHLAYTRQGAGGSSVVWILPLDGGGPSRLLDDPQLEAKQPVWSPDGRRVAFTDLGDGTMRLVDFASGHDLRFHTLNGLVGSWSPDGARIVANVLDISQEPPQGTLYVIDAADGAASQLVAPGLVDFGEPAWSPDGRWIAVSARHEAGGPDRGLWLLDPEGQDMMPVADQPGMAYGGAAWDPWGEAIIFQGVALQPLDSTPSVFVWRPGQASPDAWAADAFAPAWIP